MLTYGDNRLFLRLSLMPSLYYVYMLTAQRIDPAIWSSVFANTGFVIRILPTLQIILFYFLLYNYHDLSEKRETDIVQAALTQQLNAAEEQLAHLNHAQLQTAIYQHDIRHHLNVIAAFCESNKFSEATAYIKKGQSDAKSISLKRFCENETFNLICSSFTSEAERIDVRMTINARLLKHLSSIAKLN